MLRRGVVPHSVRHQIVDAAREQIERHAVEHQRVHRGVESSAQLRPDQRPVVQVGRRTDLLEAVAAVPVIEDIVRQRNLRMPVEFQDIAVHIGRIRAIVARRMPDAAQAV